VCLVYFLLVIEFLLAESLNVTTVTRQRLAMVANADMLVVGNRHKKERHQKEVTLTPSQPTYICSQVGSFLVTGN
jgi:hypothetical protein